MSREDIPKQRSLFTLVESQVFYEQPTNERTRSFLRLEHLFGSIEQAMEKLTDWDSRAAIVGMIEVTDLLSRSDIKAELIKELERQLGVLMPLQKNPQVDGARLQRTLRELNGLLEHLKSHACQPGQCLRSDELVSAIRQRASIPGGTCNFDLPALHHWLSKTAEYRGDQLLRWYEDLRVVREGTRLCLGMLRESARATPATAVAGFFNQNIDPALPCQLIRVGLPLAAQFFPEISGGKHRFTVRFMRQSQTTSRPSQVDEDVDFDLQCCIL